MLQESGSEGDSVFSESENSSRSESESESESEDISEESATENSEASDEIVPPATKRTKEEGWKWIVTGDRP